MNGLLTCVIETLIVTAFCFFCPSTILAQDYMDNPLQHIKLFSQDSIANDRFVMITTSKVLVNESARPLITGIDLGKMLARYIEDFEAFEGGMIPYSTIHGMKAGWRVKPIPGDPEINYFYGKKRGDPYFRRKIDITLAIAKSHKDALLAAHTYFLYVSAPPVVTHSIFNPGIVQLSGTNAFVFDNLFINFSISGDLDSDKITMAFLEDLKNGCEGLYKGEPIAPPLIHYGGELTDVTFDERYPLKIPILTIDLNKRRVRAMAGIKNIEYATSEMITDTTPKPTVSVDEEGLVEIRYKGPSFSADLCVNAVNDVGIEAEPWIRRIQVKCK